MVANALKFTESGFVQVVASVEQPESPSGALLRIEVRDSGIGIPPDRIAVLFDPFEQADASTTRHFPGAGLGLAIFQRIIRGMGGEIGCGSELGKGSTFWFTLALVVCSCDSSQTEDLRQALSLRVAEPSALPFVGLRVLLAEDNPMNRNITARMLQRMGICADLAPDGDQAVRLATTATYDVILMDCMMPGMDGLEATREIRKLLPGKGPTIIALTANAFREDREDCLRAGMDDHLGKPFTFDELSRNLRRLVPSAAQVPESPKAETSPSAAAPNPAE